MSGLDEEFSGKVHGMNLDATRPENQKIVRALGFENHGLVIRSAEGKTLWKQKDHEVDMADVRAELKSLLKDASE